VARAWRPAGELTRGVAVRRGVTSHDGEPFNADTVLFKLDRSFRRNLDRWTIKDVLAATPFEKTYPFVTRWEKLDDYTVRIHTSEPAPTLWDFIGREPMVPKAYTLKNGVEGLNDRPVGTGPWKMVEWKRKTSMLFEKNDAYWGTQPLFRTMRFQTIPEGAARIAALRAGQVGLIEGVPPFASVSYGYAAQEPYPYDPGRARALLAEAGFRDTNPLTLQLLFPAKHYGQSFDEMTPAVVEMLKDVGVQVTLKPVDFATLLQ